MTRKVALVSQKGGSGKTTLALHFAVEATARGAGVAIIDHDPQGSAMAWGKRRSHPSPKVDCVTVGTLADKLAEYAGTDLVLFDTAPHTMASASEPARLSDLIVIPCRPGIMDIDAMDATVAMVKRLKKAAVIVLSQCPPQKTVVTDLKAALSRLPVPVCPHSIGMRVAFTYPLTVGEVALEHEPAGKAAEEISKVWGWIERNA